MELASKHCSNDCTGHDTGCGNSNNELRIVFSRHFQSECAGQLAEERPLDVEDSLSGIDS
jgi:hypothetical protein